MGYFEKRDKQIAKEKIKPMRLAVDKFSREMIEKMIYKYNEGYYGWQDETLLPVLKRKLKHHVKKGYGNKNLIDIANFCMMIYNLQTKVK